MIEQIRADLSFLLSNYEKTDDVSMKAKLSDISYNLMTQIESKDKCVERLYVLYYLCINVSHLTSTQKQQQAHSFMKVLFPSENLSQKQANLMSQLISLALSIRNQEMLTCCSHYLLTCDRISLSNISQVTLPSSLAKDSPSFCAALISKGYLTNVSKTQLTQWLNSLASSLTSSTSSSPQTPLILNSCIRFSLLDGTIDSQLHFAILSLISQRKCQPLSNQFIIDIATVISQRENNEDLEERFAQIVIVANSSEMCSLSKQVKAILLDKFSNNKLMNVLCQQKTK